MSPMPPTERVILPRRQRSGSHAHAAVLGEPRATSIVQPNQAPQADAMGRAVHPDAQFPLGTDDIVCRHRRKELS